MHPRRSCSQRWILSAFTCTPSPLHPPAIGQSAFLHSSCPRHIARTHPRPSLNLTHSSAPSSSAPAGGRTATATATSHKDASRVYRALFNHNLSSLRNEDLSNLLARTGQLRSGTKPVLTSRLSACFSSIMAQVNPHPQTKETTSPSALPLSPPSSPATEAIPTFPTSISHFPGELLEPPLPIVSTYGPQERQTIQDQILPDSIISIDIGIRNLAWVELSKEGEILRWSVVDLLAPDDCSNASAEASETLGEAASVASSKELVDSSPIKKGRKEAPSKKSSTRKKTPLKVEALPYDPQLVGARLDRVLSEILPEPTSSRTPQKIVIERQRYRSMGLPEILDATIRCAVIEGMIHCWVTAWKKRNGPSSSWKSSEEDLKGVFIEGGAGREESAFVEAVPPKAVAQWWGIGQASANKESSSDNVASELDPPSLAPVKYHAKKNQSVELVNTWLDNKDADLSTTHSGPSRLRVQCSSAMKEWFRAEKKNDDLSDCLLQAVAWYEWRTHAIQEALDWSVKVPVEKKVMVKKTLRKPRVEESAE